MPTVTKDHLRRVQRRKLMRQAEGYLDLIMVFDDRWPLDHELRCRMADRAIESLEKIEEPKGHLGHIVFLKGQAYRSCEEYDKAISHLLESIEINPEHIHSYLAIAWCYKRVEQLNLAIEAMEAATELDPESAISHYNLACYLAIANEVERAIESLQVAIELNPEFRTYIADESDFDGIRHDHRFESSIGLMI